MPEGVLAAEPAMARLAWSEPALFKRWLGPDCIAVVDTSLDPRPEAPVAAALSG